MGPLGSHDHYPTFIFIFIRNGGVCVHAVPDRPSKIYHSHRTPNLHSCLNLWSDKSKLSTTPETTDSNKKIVNKSWWSVMKH